MNDLVEEEIQEYKTLNDITYGIIGCAYKVHKGLGPGLLESLYEACLFYELTESGFKVERQKELPLIYNQVRLDVGLLLNTNAIADIFKIIKNKAGTINKF